MVFIDRVCRTASKVVSALKQRCSGFIQNRDEQKDVKQPEYGDLLPTDNIQNGDEYITALRWAFENKKIRNIALTGPYGSGKSSIIETFLTEDEKIVQKQGRLKSLLSRNKAIRKSALKISMATFEQGDSAPDRKNKPISINEDEVEQGILKQLFYKVEPSKIPQSRYRKLHEIRRISVFFNIAIGLALLSLLVAIFDAPTFEKHMGAITDFLPSRFSTPFFTWAMMASLLVVLSWVGSYLYIIWIYDYNGRKICKDIDMECLKTYIERWERIKEASEKGLQKLQENLQELRDKQHSLSGITFVQLLKEFSTEEVLSDDVRSNKLLIFLLRRGYIDDKYANYINYFKGTSITKDDMNFILSVKNQAPLPFNYKLTKIPMVVERLQLYEFEQKAICNFDLMEELLTKSPSEKLTAFLVQLSDESENSWKFIDEFIDRTARLELFIELLADKWPGMWASISANETLTYERQLRYLRTMLNVADAATIEIQNQDGCMVRYFEQHEDILQQLVSCDTANVIAAINSLEVCFGALQIANVPNEVLDCVFDGCRYVLSDSMIQTVVNYKNEGALETLKKQPYTTVIALEYEPLIQYVHERFALYVRNVVLSHATLLDRAEDIVDMLIRLKDDQELQLQLIQKESFHLDSIEACAGEQVISASDKWRPIWNALLEKDVVSINWENVISYWKAYKLGKELKQYISLHADGLSEENIEVVPDDFIHEFILTDIETTVKEKLLPVLRMKNFDIVLSSIDEPTLRIMIDCQYFAFTVDTYSDIDSVSSDMSLMFILKNQDVYMSLHEDIPMTSNLLEKLLASRLRQEYKSKLFSAYAEEYMTKKIAMQMYTLHMPVTKGVFAEAWTCVDEGEQEQLLLENCTVLDAVELAQKFKEMGGNYTALADRTRRRDVIAGFELAWRLSIELQNEENERSFSCRTRRTGARCVWEDGI